MSHVNTSVVRALMALRGISQQTLCTLAHVSRNDMSRWLSDAEDGDDRVEFETQLEILKYLGIQGEMPRSDVVHYWHIHEPLLSRPDSSYAPLAVILRAFGEAQAAYLARESDPAMTFRARSCFALKFNGFQAILEVTAHPLRSISFDPDMMPGLKWIPDTFGVLLPDAKYDALQPGAMKVKSLTQHITYTSEMAQWERLRDMAHDKGIRAEQVATALMITSGVAPAAVEAATKARLERVVAPEPEQQRQVPAPVAAEAVKPAKREPQPSQPEELRLFVRPRAREAA